MAQAYISTYRNHYRGTTQERVQIVKSDIIDKCLPDNDKNLWILVEEECNHSENLAKAYTKIKELERKKNRSVYQVTYCKDQDQSTKVAEHDEALGSHLIDHCKKLYHRNIDKLLPPLLSSRRVLGYIRRSRLITPLTVYQNEFGRRACNILEGKNT